MARPRIITLLMPLPTYYNPDAQGVRKPIEKWKFTQTAEEISKHFDVGAELQVFRRDKPHGFWWDRDCWLSVETELVRPLERVTRIEEE